MKNTAYFRASYVDDLKASRSTRIRIFLNPQLLLSGDGSRPLASGEFDSESEYFLIRFPEWKKIKSATNPITCGQ